MKKPRYTEKEERIIGDCIKKSPGNLSKAFIMASKKLPHRSDKAISEHYYSKMSKNKNYIKLICGDSEITMNRKTVRDNSPAIVRNLRSRIANYLRNVFKLE